LEEIGVDEIEGARRRRMIERQALECELRCWQCESISYGGPKEGKIPEGWRTRPIVLV